MKVGSLRKFLAKRRVAFLGWGGVLAVSATALTWRLNKLLPGYSPAEVDAHNHALSLSSWLHDSVNLPYSAWSRLVFELNTHSLLLGRVASAILALGVVALFYWLVQHWHDRRTAVLTTLLFATASRFLLTARAGTAGVLLFGLFALVAFGIWLKDRPRTRYMLPLAMAAACLLLYVPGMVWFVVAGALWQWRTVAQKLVRTPLWVTGIGGLAMIGLLIPMGWSIYQQPHLALTFAGLPSAMPHLQPVLHNLLHIPLQLFNPHGGDGLLAIDVFTSVMFLGGLWVYAQHIKLARSWVLLGFVIIALALISLGTLPIDALLPFVYIVAAAGVWHLLNTWLVVFPRNVIARGIGVMLISLVVMLACFFNLRRYFVAWALSASTRATFSRHL